MTSNIMGKLLMIVETNLDIPGTELIVLKGLIILIVRIAETSLPENKAPTQPATTTKKSRMFQGSLKYECYLVTKPIAMILRSISIV
jgi:hypothetical protein